MTMSDFYTLQPVQATEAPSLPNASYADLSAVPSTSKDSVLTYEDVFGEDDPDDTIHEVVPAKRARLEPSIPNSASEWDFLLSGMDLPASVIPKHDGMPSLDVSREKTPTDVAEETSKDPVELPKKLEDCHDFYGQIKWCDDVISKIEAQLEAGHANEQERMILEAELMVNQVLEEHKQESKRQKLLDRKNTKKMLSKANKDKPLFCCFICNKGFLSEELVQEHVNETHLRNCTRYPFKCPHCHMRFAHAPNFYRHRATHEREELFKCSQCPYKFKTKVTLDIHVSRVHNEEEGCFECENCHTTYKHREELKRHSYYCDNKEKIQAKRKVAKERVRLQAIASPAMSLVSNGSGSMSTCSTSSAGRPVLDKSCPFCLDVFASMQSRNRHIQRKHPEHANSEEAKSVTYFKVDSPDLPFACTTCGKRFASSSSLQTHKKRIHEKKLDHVCQMCNKGYPLGSELRKHLRRVHNVTEVDAQDMTTF